MTCCAVARALTVLSLSVLVGCKDADSDTEPSDVDTEDVDTADVDTEDMDTADVDTEDPDTEDPDTEGTDAPDLPPARVVFIIADDFGIDTLSSYADLYDPVAGARDFPSLPVIDGICNDGVRFDAAWATPTCTPTRGSVLTGAYGFRTGLDGVGGAFQIDPTIATLPRILQTLDGFEGANIGKWHLGHAEESGGAMTPNLSGWDHYSGSLANVDDYNDWERVENGVATPQTAYATSVQVDDAIAWWTTRPVDQPSLLWLAFNAPHVPFHEPPAELHSQPLLRSVGQQYDAATEAMDTELARLMSVVDDDTLVIFLGDNGSPGRVIRADHPSERAKGSLFQGGVHVPLCARGPGVGTGNHTGLVSSVDLYATIAEAMGLSVLPDDAGPDSISLMPALMDPSVDSLRTTVYTGQTRSGQPGSGFAGGYTVRDAQYKWIGNEDGTEALYDLLADPYETTDLSADLDMASVRDRLRDEALTLRGETSP